MTGPLTQSMLDSALTDSFWCLLGNSDAIDPDRLLLLVQYMLTAYLSTLSDQQDVQVQVLALLRELLPKLPISAD